MSARRTARFVKSAMGPDQYPRDGRPEMAFVGRSNVGKSSLLNALLGQKGLAKTSNRPGKTQTLNFFEIDNRFYFVDLPGYGFAKVPLPVKREWGKIMAAYLSGRETLRAVALLVDSRHKPSERDLEMLELLDAAEVPTLIVATKVDKLKKGDRKKNLERIRTFLELDEEALIVPFSVETGEGRRQLWEVIDEVVAS
jgi:GTP-binding protein